MEGAKNILFVLTAVLFFAGGFAQNITCGDNEVVDDCPRNCTDYCPKSAEVTSCPYPDRNNCPPAKCVCSFNHRRADNGTCIPITSCPPFECAKENEEYNSCPFLCPTDSCADAPLHGVCPFPILIVLPCNPKCQCKQGFCRENGTCIPYKDNDSSSTQRSLWLGGWFI